MDLDQAAKAMKDAKIEDFLGGFNQPTYRAMRINGVRVPGLVEPAWLQQAVGGREQQTGARPTRPGFGCYRRTKNFAVNYTFALTSRAIDVLLIKLTDQAGGPDPLSGRMP